MLPYEEAIDLIENPLPVLVIPEDHHLPTAIWKVDLEISRLQEMIADLQKNRSYMINRALEVNIMEDETCKIEKKVRPIRIINVSKFRAYFPEQFRIICEMQKAELEQQMKKIGESIPVGVADKFVKKADSRECVDVKESVSYAVVKKVLE
jgi:hypothetical protein